MRHIPEEELHAYLDQALSRSQCVEIERHLTRCTRCRMAREEIAVVRDRTTDLLASLGPSWFLSPPFEPIRHQSHLRQRRRRYLAASMLVAGLVVTVLLQTRPDFPAAQVTAGITPPTSPKEVEKPPAAASGGGAEWSQPERPMPAQAATARKGSTAPEPQPAALERTSAAVTNDSSGSAASPAAATLTAVMTFENPIDASALGLPVLGDIAQIEAQPVDPIVTPPGLWLTVGSEDGRVATPAEAARIPGLPVVRVRVQPDERGAEVVAVDQVLENGEVVRTLSGPPDRVHSALAGDGEFRDPADASRLTVTIRQGDRMVAVTGPSEILGTLLSTSGLRRRY